MISLPGGEKLRMPYRPTLKPSPLWLKIKNREYSQKEGRKESF